MYCKAQSHTGNWQLQLNQTCLAVCVQVFDWSTTVRKVVVIAENTMSKSKTVVEITVAGLDAPWESTTPLMHRNCDDGVIQLSALSFDAVHAWGCRYQSCMFCTSYIAVFPIHFSQLDLNLANLEATVQAEWILAFLFLWKRHFFNDVTITSSLRSVVKGHFTIFQSHGLSGWFVPKNMKSCLNLSKLRPKYCRSLFYGQYKKIKTTPLSYMYKTDRGGLDRLGCATNQNCQHADSYVSVSTRAASRLTDVPCWPAATDKLNTLLPPRLIYTARCTSGILSKLLNIS